MGLSHCISAVQTYDRKVIPLKLSPIIDMVLKEDEEAEERLSGDWTAGTLLSNTYSLNSSERFLMRRLRVQMRAGSHAARERLTHAQEP